MPLPFLEQVLLSTHTTLQVGGPALYFAEAKTVADLEAAVSFAEQKKLPLLVMGGGSNLLVPDAGFKGVVVKVGIMGRTYQEQGEGLVELTVGAGEDLDQVIEESVERGLWGLENLSSIPGTVGATPVQNVGAYGVEVKDLLVKVTAFNLATKTLKDFTTEACQFAYRDSFFKSKAGQSYVIISVNFLLNKKINPKISYADLKNIFTSAENILHPREVRGAVINIRANKFPNWRVVGTAGSFFKNPIIKKSEAEALRARYPGLPVYPLGPTAAKVSLGYILDKVANLKGFRVGQVGLYKDQALVLINHGGATAQEIISFVKIVSAKVEELTGIKIEPEVRFVSDVVN